MKPGNHTHTAEELLERGDLRPTSNRLLVVRRLIEAKGPMSLVELETALETLERSSILRVLRLLEKGDVVHSFEDGRGVTKYEICHGESHCSVDDMHAHFYCETCERTFCFEDIAAPRIPLPEGFGIHSVNFMIKGKCPDCNYKS